MCTLLIGVSGVAVADWEVDDGHKMHYPQMPDPYGFDVDFGYWELADDWKCTETGAVGDIHFWISWFDDDPITIPWIKCEIWSNEPNGPSGYSIPKDLKWEGIFYLGQFIIAGPWDGQQLWYMPWGEIINQPHYLYWQINIPDIDDPYEQTEGEIYWLVIKMPFEEEFMVGWKNTKDYYMDHAVWRTPGSEWTMIDGIDFAFVITEGPPPVPDLDCDGRLVWEDIDPGATVTGTFTVKNIGDPGSTLNWQVTNDPPWGAWSYSPSSGSLAAGASVTVTATCVAPTTGNTLFTGNIEVCNTDDSTDCCTIPVSLKTPRTRGRISTLFSLLLEFLHRFPILEKIIATFPIFTY